MLVGVPKEIKVHEYRVGLTPSSVREMVAHGHEVRVQTDAGTGIGASDEDYRRAGAQIAASADDVYQRADMIIKVKEPQAIERAMLREGQILFTYLHLAPDPDQAAGLVKSGAVCIAYETVTAPSGGLPLLAPMSEVAGRLAVQAGARCLEKSAGGMESPSKSCGVAPGLSAPNHPPFDREQQAGDDCRCQHDQRRHRGRGTDCACLVELQYRDRRERGLG